MPERDETEAGLVLWHSTDEDSGPDVGRSVGLGNGWSLWIGEITQDRYERAGEDAAALGDASGTWIILYGPTEAETMVIGKALDAYVGEDILGAISRALTKRTSPASHLGGGHGA